MVAGEDAKARSDGTTILDRLTDPDWWPEPPTRAEWEEGRQLLRRLPWWQRTQLLALGAAARWLHVALVWAEAREARRAARVTVGPSRTRFKTGSHTRSTAAAPPPTD